MTLAEAGRWYWQQALRGVAGDPPMMALAGGAGDLLRMAWGEGAVVRLPRALEAGAALRKLRGVEARLARLVLVEVGGVPVTSLSAATVEGKIARWEEGRHVPSSRGAEVARALWRAWVEVPWSELAVVAGLVALRRTLEEHRSEGRRDHPRPWGFWVGAAEAAGQDERGGRRCSCRGVREEEYQQLLQICRHLPGVGERGTWGERPREEGMEPGWARMAEAFRSLSCEQEEELGEGLVQCFRYYLESIDREAAAEARDRVWRTLVSFGGNRRRS